MIVSGQRWLRKFAISTRHDEFGISYSDTAYVCLSTRRIRPEQTFWQDWPPKQPLKTIQIGPS